MLNNKVVVVTGGAGLLGQAFVRAIVANHGVAVIADVHADKGQAVCASISHELNTDKVSFVQLDITSKDSLQSAIHSLQHQYGRIDAVVNNAYPRNAQYGRRFEDVEYSDFCDNLGLNLGGLFLTSQQFAQHFQKQGHGNIINIASVYGVIAPKFEIYANTTMTMPVEYAAIKSGVIHLTTYMAKLFKNQKIRVNCISPGGILDQQPLSFLDAYKDNSLNKGMLDASDLTGTLVFLLSENSQYINGQNIVVDDGFVL
jgi:NAD(P)-dependent dehydrogenase (short-subunit alcohol dehydrogenase family)